jgi:hypothetical protein
MWIVKLALNKPYTFLMGALLRGACSGIGFIK